MKFQGGSAAGGGDAVGESVDGAAAQARGAAVRAHRAREQLAVRAAARPREEAIICREVASGVIHHDGDAEREDLRCMHADGGAGLGDDAEAASAEGAVGEGGGGGGAVGDEGGGAVEPGAAGEGGGGPMHDVECTRVKCAFLEGSGELALGTHDDSACMGAVLVSTLPAWNLAVKREPRVHG